MKINKVFFIFELIKVYKNMSVGDKIMLVSIWWHFTTGYDYVFPLEFFPLPEVYTQLEVSQLKTKKIYIL